MAHHEIEGASEVDVGVEALLVRELERYRVASWWPWEADSRQALLVLGVLAVLRMCPLHDFAVGHQLVLLPVTQVVGNEFRDACALLLRNALGEPHG